jgi:hypothetical protein
VGNLKLSLFASDSGTYAGGAVASLLDKSVPVNIAKKGSTKVTISFVVPSASKLPTTPFFLGGVVTGKTKIPDLTVANNAAFSRQPVTVG